MARIIIADDDELIVEVVRAVLERDGHIVGALSDGSSVRQVAEIKRPDLFILDCSMPNKSGIEALREIRQSSHCDVPVLMLTARQGQNDEAIAMQSGADDYMRKPFEPEALSVRVEAMLKAA